MKDFIRKRIREQMIDGQNMNQAMQTLCNKMTIDSYQEALYYVNKALEGMDELTKNEIIQKIHVPLENLKQEQKKIEAQIRHQRMSGDSILDEADTYWHQIQTTICEMGPAFQ
jgi:hypothetical protein